jgi:prepilin-type N-terminal cleavage/methylation domain-containing protein
MERMRGFSLVELLFVVAILSVLALIVVPAGFEYINKTRISRCITDLQTINNEIHSYYIDNNSYPANLGVIGRAAFKDPWGQPLRYNLGASLVGDISPDPLNVGSNDFDLWSKGADTLTDEPGYNTASEDDIVRASDGSSFGMRSDY